MSIPNEKCVNRRQFIQKSSATTFGIAAGIAVSRCSSVDPEVKKTRSYNSKMEYRRLGQTNLWVSAICLGGHWKRIDKIIGTKKINPYNAPTDDSTLSIFQENRNEIISKCLDVGINCIDLAGDSEAEVYARTLKGRREKMYLAYSHPASELRVPENRTTSKLLELFKAGLKRCNLEYADIWRLMALERGGRHTEKDVEAMVQALEIARKEGLCRFTGFSTHDRQWAKMLIETYPDLMQVMCTPYTAKSKLLPKDSLFDAVSKYDVGVLGIKPFASNSLFKGDGSPDSPHADEDDKRARMAVRYILSNPAITAPIPGLISTHQVDNMVKAIGERRKLDMKEMAQLEKEGNEMFARLPGKYQWLKDWEYV